MSVGWTLGSTTAHPIKDRGQLATILTVAGLHVLLVLWEQSFDESHYTYHVHESLPGLLLVVLRIALVVLFGYNLTHTMSRERSLLRKDFFQSFAVVSVVWFIACWYVSLHVVVHVVACHYSLHMSHHHISHQVKKLNLHLLVCREKMKLKK